MKWLELCAAGVMGFFVITAISDLLYDSTRNIKWKIKPIRVLKTFLPNRLKNHFKWIGNKTGLWTFEDAQDDKLIQYKEYKPILDWNGSQPIFFMRTSDEPLEAFEHCALYAAAYHNPKKMVLIFSSRIFSLPPYLKKLGNVQSEILNFTQVFQGTPLQLWYESGIWKVKSFVRRVRYLSDAGRYAFLLKHGGIYLDTDMITLRNFTDLNNALGYQSIAELNNAFMVFQPQHPFISKVMEVHKSTFHPTRGEIYYGPLLVTKVYKHYIQTQKPTDDDPAFHVSTLKMDLVYPIPYGKATHQFWKLGQDPEHEKKVNGSYTHHMWRNLMRGLVKNPRVIPPQGSILHWIAKTHCAPVVNEWMNPKNTTEN